MKEEHATTNLTPSQIERSFFAIVATGAPTGSGKILSANTITVRDENGNETPITSLPQISPENPQPNGNYSVILNPNHSQDIADAIGQGWLYVGNDGKTHMLGVVSDNSKGNEILPLIRDGAMKFSIEGWRSTENGMISVYAVAPVLDPDDPGATVSTFSRKNNGKEKIVKFKTINEARKHIRENDLKELKETHASKPTDVLGDLPAIFAKYSITDPKWIADITSDFICAANGLPYGEDDKSGEDATEKSTEETTEAKEDTAEETPVETTTETNSRKEEEVKENHFNTVILPSVSVEGHAKVAYADFAKTKEYAEAYGRALIGSAEFASDEKKEAHIRETMSAFLEKHDVTFNPDEVSFIPEVVLNKINFLLQSDNSLLGKVQIIADVFAVLGVENDATGALGRLRKATSLKTAEAQDITPRQFLARMLYKFIPIPDEMIAMNGGMSGSALVNYFNRELPQRLIRAAEEAMVLGGVKNEDGTTFAGFPISIQADGENAASKYATVHATAAKTSPLVAVLDSVAEILPTDGSVDQLYYVTSRQNFQKMKASAAAGDGSFPTNLGATKEQIANFLGVNGILELPWLEKVTAGASKNPNIATFLEKYDGFVIDMNGFAGVGNLSPKVSMTPHSRTNTQDLVGDLFIGGGLANLYAAVLVSVPAAA